MTAYIRLFIATAMALSVLPYGGAQGVCSPSATNVCLAKAGSPTDRSPSNVLTFCRDRIHIFDTCMDAAILACSLYPQAEGGLMGGKVAIDYGCSPARVTEYSELSECVDSPPSVAAIQECSTQLTNGLTASNICSSIAEYRSCIGRKMTSICSVRAATFMQGLLTHVLEVTLAKQGITLNALCPGSGTTTGSTVTTKASPPPRTSAVAAHTVYTVVRTTTGRRDTTTASGIASGNAAAPGPVGIQQSIMIFCLGVAFLAYYGRGE